MTHVVVSLPTWRCTPWLRAAVDSILVQTHRDLTLVVVNDADPDEDFAVLADIDDPRLVRFCAEANHGPDFWHEVVRRASPAPFLAIQDADDTSRPQRLEHLLAAIGDAPGASSHIGGGYSGKSHTPERRALGPKFCHRRCHAGLWRSEDLGAIGGYYGGHWFAWDTLVANTMALLGEVRGTPMPHVDEVLYEMLVREGSITHRPGVRRGEPERVRAERLLAAKWRRIWLARDKHWLVKTMREGFTADLTADHHAALGHETERLRSVLR